jgi:gamma-glutamyltranspeptidase/glutathione hydrolase
MYLVRGFFMLFILSFSLTFCAQKKNNVLQQENISPVLLGGAISSPDKYGALTAQKILKAGGNAIDAAVATAFTLAVTYPEAGNIGGGGIMTIYMNGKPYFLDYREMAPNKASTNMYLDEKGNVVSNMSTYSYKAVGVPSTVAGMWVLHKRFGKLSWKEILQPAIDYATDGFNVDTVLMQRYKDTLPKVPTGSFFKEYFGKMKEGQSFKQPELAETLKIIADKGADGFYKGAVAQKIIDTLSAHGGIITADDLADYKAKWRDPIIVKWNGMDVITSSPPSSGGIALLQLLKMKNFLADQFKGLAPNSAQYIHLIAEMEKRVYADRAEYLGDPDFVDVPIKKLLDDDYLLKRAKEVNIKAISPTENVNPGFSGEKMETTHFSIVDQWGNVVSNTYTLNGYFGTGIVVKGAGFVLNNEMDDFSAKPGVPNQFGVVGNSANKIEPKKRPLSSMTPTILTKDGKVVMVIGTPGGSRIITTVFQVLAHVYDDGMTLKEAIAAPRYHHQLFPKDTIFIETSRTYPKVNKDLEKMHYIISTTTPVTGVVAAIQVVNQKLIPEADPRAKDRTATGFFVPAKKSSNK